MATYWASRRLHNVLFLSAAMIVWLLALFAAAWAVRPPALAQANEVRLQTHSHGQSCQYALTLVSERATAQRGRLWEYGRKRGLHALGVLAYHDTQANYVRLGVFTRGVSCPPLP